MASPIFARSLRPSFASSSSLSPSESRISTFICHSCSRRHKATFARQRKALRIKPDPTFAPSKTETTDHIIFNPPSSAPNVYHTPAKFLPASDPRRKLHSLAQSPLAATGLLNSPISIPSSTSSGSPSSSSSPSRRDRLPPTVRPQYEKKYHLQPAQVEEIRRLRAEDPRQWTRMRLAEKFECSQFFISLCCCAPEIKEEREKALEAVKRRWGRKKTEAREDRQTRKALWGRDE